MLDHAAMDEVEEEKRNEIEGWISLQNTKSINLGRILIVSFQSKILGMDIIIEILWNPTSQRVNFNLPKKYNENNRLLNTSFVGLFSDKFYVPILSFLCSFVCIIVFGKSFVKVVGSASVTYILVCKLVSILPSKKLRYPLYQLIYQYTLRPRFYSLTT